ncbi:MAG: lipid-binding SYLF domain-containing protein [Alphaproteobacteria bacterium]|jgi:SH3 domain-containing YSC84-like protein 1|nr:lipid-binding SYLF domain-containing protein [Alphaproteobacteria bacterium]
MKRFATVIVAVVAVFAMSACQQMRETPAEGTERLLEWSADTVENFARKPELKNFATYIRGARAVMILPAIVKAGFFVGAEVGSGVLIARDPAGRWGQPAFYTLGAASFGLQFGVQDTETVLVIRNDGALQSILKDQGKFGADLGITVGLYGTGMEASTTTNLRLDVLAFTNSKVGAFAGASLEGAVLARRRDLNEAMYGQGATPDAIINEGRYKTPKAERLRSVLARF